MLSAKHVDHSPSTGSALRSLLFPLRSSPRLLFFLFALSPLLLRFFLMRPHFRFEDLEIWQLARTLAVRFHRLAEILDGKKMHRYAEQVRAAGLSLANNIAEGSGSSHPKEFRRYLAIARNSAFEDTSMLLVFESIGLIDPPEVDALLADCDLLSRKITNFSRSLGP